MQGDYISDLMIFLLSLMFIIVYMYMYAPIDTSRDVRLDVEDNSLQLLGQNIGITYLRTSPNGYDGTTFELISEYYSLSEGENYINDKSGISTGLTNHKTAFIASQQSRNSYIENIWLPGISEEGREQGTPFPVPSSKGVEEVQLKVE